MYNQSFISHTFSAWSLYLPVATRPQGVLGSFFNYGSRFRGQHGRRLEHHPPVKATQRGDPAAGTQPLQVLRPHLSLYSHAPVTVTNQGQTCQACLICLVSFCLKGPLHGVSPARGAVRTPQGAASPAGSDVKRFPFNGFHHSTSCTSPSPVKNKQRLYTHDSSCIKKRKKIGLRVDLKLRSKPGQLGMWKSCFHFCSSS